MHPRLERLFIHNYRCFVDFELRPEGRCLLLGYNGTGKTTVFEILGNIQDVVVDNEDVGEIFPSGTLSMLIDSPEQRIELDIASRWGTFRYALIIHHDEERENSVIASECVTLDGAPLYEFRQGTATLYRDDHTAAQSISYGSRNSFLASLEPKPEHQRLIDFKTFIEGINILHLTPDQMSGTARGNDETLERDGSNFGIWCRNLLMDDPEAVQRAKKSLEDVLDGFESIRMQQDGRARVLVVKWRKPGGTAYELDFEELSQGQKVLIALYLILHGATSHTTLLCLDEPDNFVSIREIQPFLVDLVTLSEDTGLQFFIISHTSEVIDYLGADRAILFVRDEGAPTRIGQFAEMGSALRLSELMARGWHVED